MVTANGCTYCLLPEELKTPELLEIAKKNVFECCDYDNPPPSLKGERHNYTQPNITSFSCNENP